MFSHVVFLPLKNLINTPFVNEHRFDMKSFDISFHIGRIILVLKRPYS